MKISIRTEDLPAELKKHVAAVHVSGELSLIERKLVNVLLLNAFDNLLSEEEHTIPQALLSTMIGWERSNNSKSLREALSNIATTRIQFDVLEHGEPDEWGVVTALASAKLRGGICTYAYAPELKRRFANPDIYALINVNVQRQFQGVYALALYENCIRFKRTKSTGWISVENWRKLLGVTKYDANKQPIPSAYDSFKVFSSKIVKAAVAEVNDVSDINVSPEYRRENKSVTHIRFVIRENPQNTSKEGMSDSEIRESLAYKALEGIGCFHSFIVTVIEKEGEQRAIDIATYVANQCGVTKPAAYARTLFDTNADVTPQEKIPVRQVALPQQVDDKGDDEAIRISKATTARLNAMTVENRVSYFAQYPDAGKAKSVFDTETGHYRDKLDDIGFTTFLRAKIARNDMAGEE